MAHLLDTSKGKAGFVSYMQPAWHGLGTVLNEVMTVEDALKYGGLEFHVGKAPNIHLIEWQGEEKVITSDSSFFTYRTDTFAVLGNMLGKDYTVLQNSDALSILDDVVKVNDGILFQTAGSLRGGAVTFVCCSLPEKIIVNGKDEVEQYLVVCNSHDKSMALKVFFTPIRVVCQNTLSLGVSKATKSYSIRHTTGVKGNLAQAMQILGLADKNKGLAEEAFTQMAKVKMNQSNFWNYVGNVFFSEDEKSKLRNGEKVNDVVSSIKKKAIDGVLEFAETGVGQSEAGEGSAWWAYNAVTGYLSNQKSYGSAEKRFEYLTVKTDLLDTALSLALNPQSISPLTLSGGGLLKSLNFN